MKSARIVLMVLTCSLSGCDGHNNQATENEALKNRIAALETQLGLFASRLSLLEVSSARIPFSACVLDGMKGVPSDLAAQSIKEACIHKAEAPLSNEVLAGLSGTSWYSPIWGGIGPAPWGMRVSLQNPGPFTITELTIVIGNKMTKVEKSYVLRRFPSPVERGAILGGLPPDRTMEMRLLPGKSDFTFRIDESAPQADFFKTYEWHIVAGKGFMD